MTFAISGLRRPKRSDSNPKITAPIGRMASVAVVVKMISLLDTPNWWESVSYMNTTTKKSNASSVHPKKPARTA